MVDSSISSTCPLTLLSFILFICSNNIVTNCYHIPLVALLCRPGPVFLIACAGLCWLQGESQYTEVPGESEDGGQAGAGEGELAGVEEGEEVLQLLALNTAQVHRGHSLTKRSTTSI